MAPRSAHRVLAAALGVAVLAAGVLTPDSHAQTSAVASNDPSRCSKELHDSITTTGPDGEQYPTWHPAVDPETGCYFGHEHGADPRTSNANPEMPPFGYVGSQIGDNEPHEGFKVFVINRGFQQENTTVQTDSRLVFHMGTSGTGRYTTRFHSAMFDWQSPDGRYAHLSVMADTTDKVGSTCSSPRQGGRDFSTVGCDDAYEIWTATLRLIHPNDPPYYGVDQIRAGVPLAVAVFDPIMTRVPQDNSRVLYTEVYKGGTLETALSPESQYRGCKREVYDGPVYWNNASSRTGAATVYYSNAYGQIQPGATAVGPNLIRQELSMTPRTKAEAFKYREDFCDDTVRAPN